MGVTIGGGLVGQPEPIPAAPIPAIPSNIEVVAGGRTLAHDTTTLDSTGRPYKIRPLDYIQWTIGANDNGFNWPRYTYVISHTNDKPGERAEHVADTVRFDKHGTATSFGRVTEMNDYNGKGANVGHEVDIRLMPTVSDADAQDNGLRFAFDAVIAGSTSTTDAVREVGATAFVRTGGANPLAYWSYGAIFGAIRGAGVRVISWVRGGVRAFEALGTWTVGLDMSQATITGDAIRLAPGQKISFEPTGCRALVYKAWTGDGKGDRWQFMNGPLAVLEIDSDGNIYKRGVKVL